MKVALVAALLVGVALTVVAVTIVNVQRQFLTSRIDSAISNRAIDIASLVAVGQIPRLFSRKDEEAFIQLVNSSGDVIASSDNLVGEPALSAAAYQPDIPRIDELKNVPVGESDSFRVASVTVKSPTGIVTVFVGGSLEPVNSSSVILASAFGVGVPLLMLFVGISSWYLTRRAFRPVELIRETVEEISGQIETRRVPVPVADDEIARLARTMNGMLDRVSDVQTRQKRFVSDASHELKTPLTGMKAHLETGLSDGTVVDLHKTLRDALRDIVRMEQLIETMLTDAAGDQQPRQKFRTLDLDDIVMDEVMFARQISEVEMDSRMISSAQVSGNRDKLGRVVRNVLANACHYAENVVTIRLVETDRNTTLEITDDGPGIPPEQRDRIFERFARVDDSREQERGGFGLGLAISKQIIEEHGGQIFVDPRQLRGTKIIINLPTAL